MWRIHLEGWNEGRGTINFRLWANKQSWPLSLIGIPHSPACCYVESVYSLSWCQDPSLFSARCSSRLRKMTRRWQWRKTLSGPSDQAPCSANKEALTQRRVEVSPACPPQINSDQSDLRSSPTHQEWHTVLVTQSNRQREVSIHCEWWYTGVWWRGCCPITAVKHNWYPQPLK